MLSLAVAERVLAVGRPLGDADRVQGQAGGRRVDARVHGLGQDPRLPLAKPTASLRSARPIAATSDATAVRRADDIRAVYGPPVSFSRSEVQ